MAPKRPTPVEEVQASSDEEEITSSGEEEGEGESSSEDDQTKKLEKRSSQPQLAETSKAVKKPDSAKHATSESESESEDVPLPPLNVKPLASKPMHETPTKSTIKTSKSTDVLGKSATKRGREVDKDGKDSKRSKAKDSDSVGALEKTEDTKKQLFQRLWSEEDEVALLKGVIAFIKKKGTDPTKDLNAFFDFIKISVHFDFSLNQLKDKVSRLKRKFENHVSKGKHGEDKTFSRVHDQNLFDLSKKIWGSEGLCGKSKSLAPDSEETKKVKKMEMENQVKYDKDVTRATMEDNVVKRGLDVVDRAKISKMEEQWRKLQVAELEVFLKRNELITEQGKVLLASYKKSEQHQV